MSKMHILIVTENSYSGGLDTFIANLISTWPHYDDHFTIVVNSSHPGVDFLSTLPKSRVSIIEHDLPLLWSTHEKSPSFFPGKLRSVFSFLKRPFFHHIYLNYFRKTFFYLKPDRLLVINGGYPAGWTCRAATIAWPTYGSVCHSIHNFHNYVAPMRWWESPFEKILDRQLSYACSHLVTVSSSCLQSIQQRPVLRAHARTSFIHNGIPIPSLPLAPDKSRLRSDLFLPDTTYLCLMLGTYEARKGHKYLLRAFKKVLSILPDSHLVICGYGYPADIETVQNLVASMNLASSVTLKGFQSDVTSILSASDLLIVPSISDESFGLTVLDAMSHKVPVIASNTGGIPEILTGSLAELLFDPYDTNVFSKKIVDALVDKTSSSRLVKYAYQHFLSSFTATTSSRQYSELLRESP